jgi:hypothetical protein
VADPCERYLEAAHAGLVTTHFGRVKRASTVAIDEGFPPHRALARSDGGEFSDAARTCSAWPTPSGRSDRQDESARLSAHHRRRRHGKSKSSAFSETSGPGRKSDASTAGLNPAHRLELSSRPGRRPRAFS